MKKIPLISLVFCFALGVFLSANAAFAAGGEDCGSAAPITALPFSDTGSTLDALHDYDEVCPYSGGTAGDHVYSYAPASDIVIDITLCDSLYDTKLYIYEGACDGTGTLVACDDDGCGSPGYQSILTAVALTGGNTYYIVVDGYGTSTGDYVIDVTEYEDCVVECPGGGISEGEACGEDLNGGCLSDPPVFTPVACDDTICGEAFWDGSIRDTDWFEVVLAEATTITWTVEADFDVFIGLVEMNTPGSGDCADTTGYLAPYVYGAACEEVSVEIFLPAGTHWLFVAPDFNGATFECGEYVATLSCASCPDADGDGYYDAACGGDDCDDSDANVNPGMAEDCENTIDDDCDGDVDDDDTECWNIVGDDCSDPVAFACGDCVVGSTVGHTNAHDCGFGHAGLDAVYELVVAEDAEVTFIGEADYDADWTIATACDELTGDIGCFDAYGTQTDPSCSEIAHVSYGYMNFTEYLAAGTYYIWIDGYYAEGAGNYALEVTCLVCEDADGDGYPAETCGGDDCDDTDPDINPGAAEACFDGIDNDCDGFVDLDDDDCLCVEADFTIECGGMASGDTTASTNDLDGYSCTSLGESGPDDVYSLTITDPVLVVVDLTNLAVDNDLFLLGDTGGYACNTACLDYSAGVSDENIAIELDAGTYYIVVDGYGGAAGPYDLAVQCCLDNDGDGFYDEACGGDDCDDTDPDINPDAEEICDDGIDNNCDGLVDIGPWVCCEVECPDGAILEAEPCGDDTNGGCNADPYVVGYMANGDTVCGNVWADEAFRDTDWYEIELTETSVVTFKVEAEFPLQTILIDSGTGNCDDPYDYILGTEDPCTDLTLTMTLDAGIHWLWVGPSGFDGGPCEAGPHDYTASVSWVPCYDDDGDGFYAEPCGNDCDDANGIINPCGIEIAGNGIDENCTGWDLSATPTVEVEPNDFATPQDLGTIYGCDVNTVTGALVTGDQDFYKFSVPASGYADIALAFECGALDFDLYLFIYDEVGTIIDVSFYDTPEFITDAFLDTEAWGFDYGIAAMQYSGEGDYELEFNFHECVEESFWAGNCNDGIDNDCDGLIDNDPECKLCFIENIF